MLDHLKNTTVAVFGMYAGDEGKGKITASLVRQAEISYVVRYQGGSNAGHTLVVNGREFKARLLPSGVVHPGTINVIGPGVALNIRALQTEVKDLLATGFTDPNLVVSHRAQLVLPHHVLLDELEEKRRDAAKFGSTKQGIAFFYAQVARKTGIQVGCLYNDAELEARVEESMLEANVLLEHLYKHPQVDVKSVVKELKSLREWVKPYLADTTELLHAAAAQGKGMLFEAQLGVLRDVFHGQHPWTTSSSTLAGFVETGAGIAAKKRIGVLKAYSSMVGTGSRLTAIEDAELENELRRIGGNRGEFGVNTGRPRDLAWLDLAAARYAAMLNGATDLALTCLDVWGELGLPEIKVCVGYELDGKRVGSYPMRDDIGRVRPIYEVVPGWSISKEEIRKCRTLSDLPKPARAFLDLIEQQVGVPVTIVSVGPGDDELIVCR